MTIKNEGFIFVLIGAASLILSEEITGLQWAGILLIVGAICLNEVGNARMHYHLKKPAP
ncbi:drug/metabolite transporter (DMT)-like permease [Virgibacillus natechei]|uniref:Drug/metabolite transporter (DMT)-like permease n=2 Tax=Virgibacillus natechei TaxID=1216297 RepID=A0ABS4IJ72_9BACI|nr:drug/metabolite transporter (DMT)-like permease [Virgibacillus natechei]